MDTTIDSSPITSTKLSSDNKVKENSQILETKSGVPPENPSVSEELETSTTEILQTDGKNTLSTLESVASPESPTSEQDSVPGSLSSTGQALATGDINYVSEVESSESRSSDTEMTVTLEESGSQGQRNVTKGVKHQCNFCEQYFSRPNQLAKHICAHTGDTPYLTDKSGSKGRRGRSASGDTKGGKKKYRCGVCGKNFSQSGGLALHLNIHTGAKPYTCDVCGSSFNQPGNLAQHKRIHTGERPHVCEICNKTFGDPSSFRQHKRIHTQDKQFKCHLCEKSFLQSNHLSVHMRTHTGEKPYKCDVCGKTFTVSSNLTRHKTSHVEEKPYICGECGKSFANCANLVRHARIHTGVKPYVCEFCGRVYSTASNLASHRRSHAGEIPPNSITVQDSDTSMQIIGHFPSGQFPS